MSLLSLSALGPVKGMVLTDIQSSSSILHKPSLKAKKSILCDWGKLRAAKYCNILQLLQLFIIVVYKSIAIIIIAGLVSILLQYYY